MNPQQIIKVLLYPKIKPNEKRQNICLWKHIQVWFCYVNAIKRFVMLRETILGINPEGAIFEFSDYKFEKEGRNFDLENS